MGRSRCPRAPRRARRGPRPDGGHPARHDRGRRGPAPAGDRGVACGGAGVRLSAVAAPAGPHMIGAQGSPGARFFCSITVVTLRPE
jgi:hypothetical protein